jgi:NifU-like protein involved in Fe-S cluster formation
MADIIDIKKRTDKVWFYTQTVKDHFMNPKNIVMSEKDVEKIDPNGVGEVGSPACGDVMKFWIHVDKKTKKITKCKWKTFGCASAIASTSMLSEMVTENGGMTFEEARKLKPKDILKRLGGLPTVKIHCSVLGDQALRAAIDDYLSKKE